MANKTIPILLIRLSNRSSTHASKIVGQILQFLRYSPIPEGIYRKSFHNVFYNKRLSPPRVRLDCSLRQTVFNVEYSRSDSSGICKVST